VTNLVPPPEIALITPAAKAATKINSAVFSWYWPSTWCRQRGVASLAAIEPAGAAVCIRAILATTGSIPVYTRTGNVIAAPAS
jgi:hypothetical protein